MVSRGLGQHLGTLKPPCQEAAPSLSPPRGIGWEQEGRGHGPPTKESGSGSPSPTPALRQAQRLGRIAGRSIGRRPGVVVGCQGCLGAARLAAGEEVVYGRRLGEYILR